MTTFSKVAKANNSFSKAIKDAVTYTIVGGSYLLRQDSGFLLLQSGGQIIIGATSTEERQSPTYTKIAK